MCWIFACVFFYAGWTLVPGINHNITWRDLVNYTWVSFPLETPKVLLDDDALFGRVKERMAAARKA